MDRKQEVQEIDRKLFLLVGTVTAVITVLLATIAVLLKLHWSLVLCVGLIIGIGMSFVHNWLAAKISLKHNMDLAPSLVDRVLRPEPKKVIPTALMLYEEPEPYKDPWIHDDDPKDFK